MMTTQKLKALVNTVIKQSTLDSSQITDPTQKFSLIAGDKIEINDYKYRPGSEISICIEKKCLIRIHIESETMFWQMHEHLFSSLFTLYISL